MVDVCAWWNLHGLFYCAGTDAPLAGSAVATDPKRHHLHHGDGVHHRNYHQQMAASSGLGLYRSAFSAVWADLFTVCIDLFGIMCFGNSAVRVSSVLAVRGGKAKLYSLKRGRSVL